jgi:hypothetical protein
VWISDHIPIVSEMHHRGYKASGFGKDMSAYSLEEYTHIKHVMLGRRRPEGLAGYRLPPPEPAESHAANSGQREGAKRWQKFP